MATDTKKEHRVNRVLRLAWKYKKVTAYILIDTWAFIFTAGFTRAMIPFPYETLGYIAAGWSYGMLVAMLFASYFEKEAEEKENERMETIAKAIGQLVDQSKKERVIQELQREGIYLTTQIKRLKAD